MTLAALLSEPGNVAKQRELTASPITSDSQIVLFGAGRLGKKVLQVIRSHGIEPVAFVDNSQELQGNIIDGLKVLSPEAAARELGATAIFVVTIFRGSGDAGMAARERQLKALGCRRVTNFLPLAWQYSLELLPHYGAALPSTYLDASSDLLRVDAVWSDSESRETFRRQLSWRLRGDFSEHVSLAPDQYFPKDLFTVTPEECFVDGGAYDGDTLKALGGNFKKAWAIEPNPRCVAQIRARCDDRVTTVECGLGMMPDGDQFLEEDGVASFVNRVRGIKIKIDTLDRILVGQTPTLLKLDIEGSEQDALLGGIDVLRRARPIVAVCVYHRPDDIWKIPRILTKILPEHRLFLRAHQNDGFELVAYAVPEERLL